MTERLLFPIQTAKFKITAPTGGFANHLRWLVLLDDSYSFSICPVQSRYKIFAGPDWPTYENYCTNNYTGIKQEIIEEIEQLCHEHTNIKIWKFFSAEDKIKFINDQIYPDSRTWQNWLNFEWQYRIELNNAIFLTHWIKTDTSNLPGIYLDIEPELALRQYIKFNSNLNNMTFDQFKTVVNIYRDELSLLPTDNNLILKSDNLYQSKLDPELYAKITQYLGINGNYNLANCVHERWYHLHRRAEKEIGEFFTSFYQ